MVQDCWQWLKKQYPLVELDNFIIMLNHLHSIIIIHDSRRSGSGTAPTPKPRIVYKIVKKIFLRNESATVTIA
ncbi:MAG: hypothetical protein D6732_00590 [Methanobacteriota archaeon]|nr:MAG: hypothetical protein D6732_00590 [Euryarchaeota archaeon]